MKHLHQQDVSIKAPSRGMWQRSLLSLFLVLACFAGVIGKLAVVQLAQHDLWQGLSNEQQLTDSVISDKRGEIVDRNGVVLARSTEVATILMIPREIPSDEARERICRDLPSLLEIGEQKLKKQVAKTRSRYEVICSKIDYTACERFIAWVKENGLIAAFRVIQDYKREYPYGSMLSCVMGFTGADNNGLEGLEAKYDAVLKGTAGRIITTQNGRGDALPNDLRYETAVESQEGNTVVLTIDATVQQMVENHLQTVLNETAAANRVSSIVMDVRTGEVLAMATKGDYDLNAPRVVQNPDQAALIAALAGDEQAEAYLTALQKQWKNKAVSEFYEPGSVFKIFTASTALQEGLISEASSFHCNGTYTMAGVRTMKCHVFPRSHGSQTLAEAISHSCNPAFMTIGSRIGTSLFASYHAKFGFTELSGIDMLGEARVTAALYHSADSITAVDVATSSIGQTFKVTPIQMITGVSAVAGGGELLQPYVVSEVRSPEGEVISRTERTVRRRVISADTAKRMCTMLEGVVDGGGAKNAYVAGYRVAGKTGTSEKTDQAASASGRKNAVASFCGFAPADNPQIAVIVMIDEPQTAIRYGGTLAAPVAQRIFADVLPYLGVEPQYKESELEKLKVSVPNVAGKSLAAAQRALAEKGLQTRVAGNGSQVTGQMPLEGATMDKNGTVVLYTDGERPCEVTVPLAVGKTLLQANRLLTDAGLNIKIVGYPTEWTDDLSARQAVVISQTIGENTAVPEGTVVEIHIAYQDAIE